MMPIVDPAMEREARPGMEPRTPRRPALVASAGRAYTDPRFRPDASYVLGGPGESAFEKPLRPRDDARLDGRTFLRRHASSKDARA